MGSCISDEWWPTFFRMWAEWDFRDLLALFWSALRACA